MPPSFRKELDAVPGRIDLIAPGIRRVLAPNPSAFTYLGTGTYIVGSGTVAVIDPGPASAEHIDALATALNGETVSHIVCTHTHADHSPGSRLLQERVGGLIVGCAPHPDGDTMVEISSSTEEHFDADHVPQWLMTDGDRIDGPGWTLEAVHTPGHIANHLCFAFLEQSVLFSGDHVMAWSTSVVSPPGGDLDDYLESLHKVLARTELTYWPTHGPSVDDPQRFVAELIEHRNGRTAQVLEALAIGPLTIPELVGRMYPGLDERLIKAAGRSVLAHLESLERKLLVTANPDPVGAGPDQQASDQAESAGDRVRYTLLAA
jgi:glyoxylase-like metal-dependent hydrolase (beta-lactamase superfamily II)